MTISNTDMCFLDSSKVVKMTVISLGCHNTDIEAYVMCQGSHYASFQTMT